jgi:VanZ family protein
MTAIGMRVRLPRLGEIRVRLPLLPTALRWAIVLFVASMIFYASIITTPTATPPPESGPAVTAPTRAGVDAAQPVVDSSKPEPGTLDWIRQYIGVVPEVIPLDKWRHFIAYGGFGATLAYATADWKRDMRVLAVLVLGTTMAYGIGIEAWQAFIPERSFSYGDMYANALGAVLLSPWYLVRPYVRFEPIVDWVRGFRFPWTGG